MTFFCNSRKRGHGGLPKVEPSEEYAGEGYCKTPLTEASRCHWHGRGSLRADQHPNWKDGQHSKYRYRVSDALSEALEYRDSEDWRELNQHGWLLVGMIQTALDDFESPMPKAAHMESLLREARSSVAGNDPGGANFKIERALDLMAQYRKNWEALGRASALIDQHRKLAESADKQDLTKKAMLHIDDVTLMLADVAQIVSKAADTSITDPAERMRLMDSVRTGLLLRGDEHEQRGREIPLALPA